VHACRRRSSCWPQFTKAARRPIARPPPTSAVAAIGGQDRRDIIDRVYAVLRHRARLEWWLSRVVGDGTISDRWRMIAAWRCWTAGPPTA
jgi:hypothetical protein